MRVKVTWYLDTGDPIEMLADNFTSLDEAKETLAQGLQQTVVTITDDGVAYVIPTSTIKRVDIIVVKH